MTVININNISGIASVNAQSGSLELFTNAGASLLDLNANLATFPADITFRNINTTGIITASKFVGIFEADSGSTGTFDSLTVSGNVSVGGTLTYDDVTNIDSVGVVTARSGINVTGGHIGVGVTPESWSTNLKAVQIGRQACVTGQTGANIVEISANAYHDSGWKYIENDTATSYYQYQRDHVFSSAASGTADAAISFTETLRITGIGSVGISSTAPKTDVDISQKTGAVALPQGTTAQRPTGSAPYIRKNTTNSALEFYNGTEWVEIITDYFPTGSVILG